MHIKTQNLSPPFCQSSTKGLKTKQPNKFSPPICPKQRTKEGVSQINQKKFICDIHS